MFLPVSYITFKSSTRPETAYNEDDRHIDDPPNNEILDFSEGNARI